MEISNRKLLSRGVVAIGLVVAVSGVPGEGVAGERPDLSPVTWGAEANPLTEQKISTADKPGNSAVRKSSKRRLNSMSRSWRA